MTDLLAISAIALFLLLLLVALSVIKKAGQTGSETTRKVVHIGLGLICLSFPWVFSSFLPVLLLCVISLVFLLYVRREDSGLRGVLHGVSRESHGDLYFPIAVTLLFFLHTDPIIQYIIPLLLLTLADAMGALIGVRYGKSHYTTDDGLKSVEGSVAFFLIAFLSTHIVLLLGTDTGRLESLLISVIIGLLVMLVEAISWRGLDNLFIPLGAYLLLDVYLQMGAADLGLRIFILAVIGLFFLLLAQRSFARSGTLLAGLLTLYLIWGLGGWKWAIPPIAFALSYSLLCPRGQPDFHNRHRLLDLGAVAGGGLCWLFLSMAYNRPELALPFTLSWAAQTAITVTAFVAWKQPGTPSLTIAFTGGLVGLALYALPLILILPLPLQPGMLPLLFVSGALAATFLWIGEWKRFGTTLEPNRPWRQLGYGLIASSPGLLLL
ncbi:MAG: hypothetical protein JJT75_04595 [Opitutales bacterium]|nr:hypothetical protein [Opitutales bacterium]MCH8540447.1 hypothetical protein [Opitutales bacterium]